MYKKYSIENKTKNKLILSSYPKNVEDTYSWVFLSVEIFVRMLTLFASTSHTTYYMLNIVTQNNFCS